METIVESGTPEQPPETPTKKTPRRRSSLRQFFKFLGTFEQNPVTRTPSFTKREKEKDGEVPQSKDDSVVYSESQSSKKSVRNKPSRRGESFNIRRKNKKEESRDRPTSWHPDEVVQTDKKHKRHSLAALRGSESRSEKYLAASGDGTMQYSQKPDTLSSHASFHSLHHGNATSMASISTQPEYGGSQNSMAMSASMASATSWHGPPHGSWGSPEPRPGGAPPLQPRNRQGISFDHINHNLTPKVYENDYKQDYKVMSAHSMHDVRQLQKPPQYSPMGYSPYQPRTASTYSRYNSNYENIEKLEGPPSGSATPSPRTFTLSSPSLYKPGTDLPSPGPPPPLPPKDINVLPLKSRPACDSPPAPPVRDASSLKYKSQNHEKYPSWPVAELGQESGSKSPSTSRTNSWAPSTTTSQDFPKKPHVYQPQLNPHIEERSPTSIKKYFEQEKLKTEPPFRADFIQEALARAEGGAFSLHDTSYPADPKGEVEINNLFNTRYPFPVYDRDGRGKGDKDYTVPSPPERDIPLEKKSGRLWRSETLTLSDEKPATEMPMLDELLKQYSNKMKSAEPPSPLSPAGSTPPPLPDNPPPPLPQTAPPLPQTAPPPVLTHMAGHQTVTIPRSPQHSSYTYIVRNKPCYNTSTQTECTPPSTRSGSPEQPDNLLYEPPTYRNAEVQCDMDNEYEGKVIFSAVAPSPFSTLERRRTLKSDVSTQIKAVTEALTTWREKEARLSSEPPACAPPPIPYPHSREQHRHAPIIDKMEHERRIPETIQEVSQEQSPKRGGSTTTPPRIKPNKAIQDDILQQIHEHSPSQTSMLRKLSQEFFGQSKRSGLGYTSRLGVHHERGASDASKSDHDRTLSDVTSGFSSPRQLSLSSQSTSQLSVYPHHDNNNRLSMESTHSSKHSSSDYFSDSEPPSGSREDVTWKGKPAGIDQSKTKKTPPSEGRLDRSKKRSLKKAYGIFDEIENFDRPPRRIGHQGKSKSTGNVLVASVTKDTHEEEAPVQPPSSANDNQPPTPPVNTSYDDTVKKLQDSPRKIKRTSSEKLRPNKHRQQERTSADDSRIHHKLSDPGSEKRKERRYSHHVLSPRQRHSDPLENEPQRRKSDHVYRNSSGSDHRISSGSDCVFQGYPDQMPPSTRSTSSSSSLEERGRNSDPQVKKLQQQALLSFYEKKTGKRLSVTSMESTGNVSDRTVPKDRVDSGNASDQGKDYGDNSSNERTLPKEHMDSLQSMDRDSSPPPPYEAIKKSKSFPRDMVASAGMESPEPRPRERRRSSGRLDHTHKKGKSLPAPMEPRTRQRSGSLDISGTPSTPEVQPSSAEKSVTLPANTSTDTDTSLTLLKSYEYSSSSSNSSSPTKTPTQEFNKYSYQVTVNKNYATTEGDVDSSPPVLPPRNYKSSQAERHEYKPPKPLPTGAHGATNITMDYDQTPKADYYADQLRQQARRISSQQSTKLNAARMQYQSKPTDLKMTVSVSRPVDRQPTPQEASAPPTYRLSDSNQDLPYSPSEELPKTNISASSENGIEIPVEHITTNGSGKSEGSHKARRPVLEFPSPPPLSQLEAEDLASPVDEPPPVPPPPLPEKDIDPDDPRLKLSFDDPNSANSSPRYPAESYMRYRNSPRQGFSGNYRRSSELRTPTTPDGVKDAISLLTADTSASSPVQHNDNLVQVTTVTTVNKAMPVAESKVQLEHGPPRTPYSRISPTGPPLVTQDDSVLPSRPRKHSFGEPLVNGAPDEQTVTESPSVRRFIANFEQRQSQENLYEPDRPVPPQRTKNKIFELKNTLLRKSNENLLNIDSTEPETRVTENVTKITIVPNRAEITPNRYTSPTTPTSAERKQLQETHFDADTTLVETSPTVTTTTVSSPPSTISTTSATLPPPPPPPPLESEPDNSSPRTVHQRQKSQEEIDCEQQAAIVAIHIQQEDKRLSDVILPPPEHKSATGYISGLFDTNVDMSRSPKRAAYEATSDRRSSFGMRFDSSPGSPLWLSPGLSNIHSRLRDEGVPPQQLLQELGAPDYSLQRQKEELVNRIKRKLETLQDEKKMLKDEISENNSLGKQITALVESKCNSRAEFDKYKLYVTEIDKVLYLLLKISSRLARTENSLLTLSDDAPDDEQSLLMSKRDELQEKLDDAKLLKEGIDRRRDQVATYLKKYLTPEEFEDYEHFVKYKSKLTLEVQEIDDQYALGEEQLKALQRSMTCSSA